MKATISEINKLYPETEAFTFYKIEEPHIFNFILDYNKDRFGDEVICDTYCIILDEKEKTLKVDYVVIYRGEELNSITISEYYDKLENLASNPNLKSSTLETINRFVPELL